jgi:putative SOS response-associated peptidase YedK
MCGRFTLAHPADDIENFYKVELPADFLPRYNVAPTQRILTIKNTTPKKAELMRWGLIPFWAKDEKIGNSLINARAETIETKPAFRTSFKKKRCLILADGFFEWKKEGKTKQPYRIHMKDDGLFAFAGLWDEWNSFETCTIVTTEPNELVREIHDRMPVILAKDDFDKWLEFADLDLLKPYPSEFMDMYEVSNACNKAGFESPECIEKIK